MSETDIEAQGRMGEDALNDWLRANGLSYVAICQNQHTFSSLFPGNVKRPDFLVMLEALGLIGVDAKNYTISPGNVYTLNHDKELRLALAFERLFRIPIWYAYCSDDFKTWYWISGLKAVEVGEIRTRNDNQEPFLAIDLEHFEEIRTNADLGKLYTHRLPSFARNAEIAGRVTSHKA